ncbi:hypothetical protein TNCV_5012871 [Trichonephila clavipes]|nr:hypothetical protein TNCV_5012871 [Trichonephila clavipes]
MYRPMLTTIDHQYSFSQKRVVGGAGLCKYNMLTKYQMIKFIDFYEVWFLPESVARVAAIDGDHRCHMPRH